MIASPEDQARRQLEDAARQIVASVRHALEARHEETPTDRTEFTDRDLAYYDCTAREMDALGFRALGAFEVASTRSGPLEGRNFSEYALSRDGTVIANWFALKTRTGVRETLVFQSFTVDERVISTGRGLLDVGLPYPPDRAPVLVADGTPTATMLDAHAARIAADGAPSRSFLGIDEILSARLDSSRRTTEYRRGLGIGVYESVLKKRFGADPQRIGATLLTLIRAHPEWHAPAS